MATPRAGKGGRDPFPLPGQTLLSHGRHDGPDAPRTPRAAAARRDRSRPRVPPGRPCAARPPHRSVTGDDRLTAPRACGPATTAAAGWAAARAASALRSAPGAGGRHPITSMPRTIPLQALRSSQLGPALLLSGPSAPATRSAACQGEPSPQRGPNRDRITSERHVHVRRARCMRTHARRMQVAMRRMRHGGTVPTAAAC